MNQNVNELWLVLDMDIENKQILNSLELDVVQLIVEVVHEWNYQLVEDQNSL